MKKILGLDLGTNSIGWAYIKESDDENIPSSIEKVGVRVNPLTVDEQINFEKGKPITTNAKRTLARSARRTLQRYKLRRESLINVLLKNKWINKTTVLIENTKESTFETYSLRDKSASEEITLEEFARVLLMINKKRGYKSNRRVNNPEEGSLIDGMEVAKKLHEENLTPGQYTYQLLKDGKKQIPDFYRSDLQNELDKVWQFQKQFHLEILTEPFKKELEGKGQRATSDVFKRLKIYTSENKGSREEKKLQAYKWRADALSEALTVEEMAFVITEINNNLNSSSGYLGEISDRSKELFFNNQTVGQYLYKQLQENPHARLKNQIFYRQDYLDEFEKIWETQSKYHKELTAKIKKEIQDETIFYQRKLKSQKNLISFCEFESQEKELLIDGKKTIKTIGLKVAPKSSPLFQEFKIWQILNNLEFKNKENKEKKTLDLECKLMLFEELNIKGNLKANKIVELLGYNPKEWSLNYKEVEGNKTNESLYNAYLKILEIEGYHEYLLKLSNKDDIKINALETPAENIKEMVKAIFDVLEIDTSILEFNAELEGKEFEKQTSYALWHLLYSYEDDDSKSGNEKLYELLYKKFGFKREHGQILANVALSDDYGSLSAKAMRKIFPHIKENVFSKACELAGYRHSKQSLTTEEIDNRPLEDKLDLLRKNSLRNPVVEKILNQMVNVVNTLIESESEKDAQGNIIKYFKFDEIRIELARELKKSAKEREEMTLNIGKAKKRHEEIVKIIQKDFNINNPTRNDIIRYKLYEELAKNGYKNLYDSQQIIYAKLFGKDYDIDHIIPQSRLFDDSFSNKTIVPRQINLDKSNQTAVDYISSTFSENKLEEYKLRIENLYKEGALSRAKYYKLLKTESDIGDGFIERDLRETQYIAKKAKEILLGISRKVIPTSGSVTDKLREDWGLINVMKELNLPKFRQLGMTEIITTKDGQEKEIITDWTKRNDHRHHAMDALTIAFTKHEHIQYLNYLNARKNEKHKEHAHILGIEDKIKEVYITKSGKEKTRFKSPLPNFRLEAKKHLETVLISYKAKNKVITKNINTFLTKKGKDKKTELTPRGQLHKETVYGKLQQYVTKEEKIGPKFNIETIQKTANQSYREALLERLEEYNNDPKKAFGGKNALNKNPIYLDKSKEKTLPETVKLVWFEEDYTIRKEVNPDNFKDYKSLDKIIDVGIRNILNERLSKYDENAKEAFSDLEKNPIWLNKEKGITIKRVTISGVKNVEALHHKKDHFGKEILDKNGNLIPTDFVSTGNNHHVAIYRDEKGNLQENIVSFYEAVARVNEGLPIIDKSYKSEEGYQFLFTMKQNEYFVFPSEDFDPSEIDLLNPKNYSTISPNLFRVQKITTKDYSFRHHLETKIEDNSDLKNVTWKREGLKGIQEIIKVRVNHIGEIVSIGEY